MEDMDYVFWLIGVCILCFILQSILPGFTDALLLDQSKPLQIWRFLTAMFLHADILHILSNMFVLFMFGIALERFVGSKRFLLIYFVSGIIANIISINFYPSSLGASGAIFGVIGALVIIRPTLTVFAFGMPMPMFVAGTLWALLDLMGVFMPSNVANIAHLSGIVVGLTLGVLYRDWSRTERKQTKIVIDERYIQEWENRHFG